MKTNTNTKTTTMTNTFKEHLQRKIFEIFGLESYAKTWDDQQKVNDEDKYKDNNNDKFI